MVPKEREQGSRMFLAPDVMENGQEWKLWRENAPVEADLTLFLCSQPNYYCIHHHSTKKQTIIKNNKSHFLHKQEKYEEYTLKVV